MLEVPGGDLDAAIGIDPARARGSDNAAVALESVAGGVGEQMPQRGVRRADGVAQRDRTLLDPDQDRVPGEELPDGRHPKDPVAVPSDPRLAPGRDNGRGRM